MATSVNTSKADWINFFMPEGEANVARRQEHGDYIPDPYSAALAYAGFAAFDAMMKGSKFQNVDLDRARAVADYMCGRVAQPERLAA